MDVNIANSVGMGFLRSFYTCKGAEIMVIRQEIQSDYDGVYNAVKCAFETAQHSDGTEQDLVEALRKGKSFIPELSLVAEADGEIAGHILFTKGSVGRDTVLILAPLSVSPAFQNQGIGRALVNEGHRIAGEMGFDYALVLGNEEYYPRFGYVPAETFGIEVPKGIPSQNFMAVKLSGNPPPIKGAVTYPKEFGM